MPTEKFGRYEIKGEIGRGGMATVFHAYDPRFERDVAIKVLPRAFLHDPHFRVRFEREAKTIALLEHPAIVPVYDFGEEEGQPYIVMRYMSGGSLSERIKQSPLSADEAAQIISRLAPALDAAHARGIIHRDMKPGNVLFDQYGNAFLSDFGIARITQSPGSATLTQGAILGTPAYMSPEQVQGNTDLDGRSDIYSLGVILYEMLTGNTPYQSDTPGKVMIMHLLEQVPHIRTVRSDISPGLDSAIEKAMAKDPSQRFQNTAEMAAAVDAAVKGLSEATKVQAPPTKIGKLSKPDRTGPQAPLQKVPTVVPTVVSVPAAPKGRGIPAWGYIIGIIGVLIIGGGIIVGLLAALNGKIPFLTKASTATQVSQIIPTALPTDTLVPSPEPTDTVEPSPLPTDTSEPSPTFTDTPAPTIEDTPTDTPTPTEKSIAQLGGADKIAFLNANDIWVAGVDGSDMVQLTNDGAVKSYLQWSPDGSSVIYVSKKCVKMVNYETKALDVVACFNSSEFLEGFSISPSGKLVAISTDRMLYILPFNLDVLKTITNRNQLIPLSVCTNAPYSNIAYKEVQWSTDEKNVAVSFLSAQGGRHVDLIRLMKIDNCPVTPPRLDEFPATRFTMSGYTENPWISSFTWNGDDLFVLNSQLRNDGFGYLYIYNSTKKILQKIDPRADYVSPVGSCCYRDARFSPDGSYLAFAFQDINLGDQNLIQLYYIPFGEIGTGFNLEPLPIPEYFWQSRTEKVWPALRPAQ